VCREQHLHTSITFSHLYSSTTGLRWAQTHSIYHTRTHLFLSMTFHSSPSVLWGDPSSLSLHRITFVHTHSLSGYIHRCMCRRVCFNLQERNTHTHTHTSIQLATYQNLNSSFLGVNHGVEGLSKTPHLHPELLSGVMASALLPLKPFVTMSPTVWQLWLINENQNASR